MSAKLYVKTVHITDEDLLVNQLTQKITLEYYLTEQVNDWEGTAKKRYGVEVVKRHVDHHACVKTEVVGVKDVLTNKEEMLSLIKNIAKHSVTPLTLKDVLEDMVG
ncbi:MAG: hypothetical protein H7Y41_00765 [Hyphomonadaceae bacterium]|nr:hypothetical protein [Clostridia bacterium]